MKQVVYYALFVDSIQLVTFDGKKIISEYNDVETGKKVRTVFTKKLETDIVKMVLGSPIYMEIGEL